MPPIICSNLKAILNYQFRRDNAYGVDELEKNLQIDEGSNTKKLSQPLFVDLSAPTNTRSYKAGSISRGQCDKDGDYGYRVDRSKLKHWEFDSEGFLRIIFPVAREGWMNYLNIDGSLRREYVSAQTLWNSADSFKLKPITLKHPEIDGGIVTPYNAKDLQIGMTGNTAIIDNGILFLTGVVTVVEGINSIINGDTGEVSCGYKATVIPHGDDWEQIGREGNHVAAVQFARGGKDLAFRIKPYMDGLDKKDQSEIWCNKYAIDADVPKNISIERSQRVQIVIGRKAYQIDGADSEALAEAIGELQVKADELPTVKSELETTKKKLDTVQGKLDATEAALTQQKKDAVDTSKYISLDEMQVRMTLWDEVSGFLLRSDSNFKRDNSLTPVEIQKLFLSKRLPNVKLDGKSDEYILSLYENRDLYGAREDTSLGDYHHLDADLNDIYRSRNDSTTTAKEEEKTANTTRNNYQNAWKKKNRASED